MLAVTVTAGGFLTRTPLAPLPLVVLIALSAWYLRCLRRLEPTEQWPVGRTAAWFVGIAMSAFCLLLGMAGYDGVDFLIHGTIDAAVGMVAPFAFALGAPLTLARRGGGRRARHLAAALQEGRAGELLFKPLVVWVVYTASLFGLYFLPVYKHIRTHVALLDLAHFEFALAGCLLVWPLVGADLRGRLTQGQRMAWLGFGIPYYSVFGMAALSVGSVPAPSFTLADVHGGGDVIWSTGECIAVGGMVAVLFWWLFTELSRAKEEDTADREALDLQASMWRVSRILAKTEAQKAQERAAAVAATTVAARTRTGADTSPSSSSDEGPPGPGALPA